MEKQTKIELFKDIQVEEHFEAKYSSTVKNGLGKPYECYIRRGKKGLVDKGFLIPNDKDYTFIHVPAFNFLGATSGTLFRFNTNEDGLPMVYDVILPDLNSLSKSQIFEFIDSVIQRYNDGEFEWSFEERRYSYNSKLKNCE